MREALLSPFPRAQTMKMLLVLLAEATELLRAAKEEEADAVTVARLREHAAKEGVRKAEEAREAIIAALIEANGAPE